MSQSSKRTGAQLHRKASVNLDRISWDDLRLFVAAARSDSFRKAAVGLRTSSSTVVRRMERLEQQLGQRLFNRVPEGVVLTEDGHRILSAAQEMERASHSLRRHLDQDVMTRGTVKMAITEGLGSYWVLPRLAEFSRENPYTIIDLHCSMAYSDVMRMQSDLSVQLTRPTAQDAIGIKLGRMHLYPFASQRYLDTYGIPSTVQDLVQHKIVDQHSPMLSSDALASALGVSSLEGIVALRTNSSSAHVLAVHSGMGIGVLPTYARVLGADVEPLDIGLSYSVDIWLTYHPDVKQVPRVAMFIEWIKNAFEPKNFPWFRDEFVHPNDFRNWHEKHGVSDVVISGRK